MTDTHLDLAGIKARAEAAPLGPWAGSTCSTTLALVAEVERLTVEVARLRARQLPPDVCGATDQDSRVVCTLKPHSVELLPRVHPMHRRFHQDWRGGVLWAEWSSVTDDDEGRLWPDGHIGRRAALTPDGES